MTTDAQTTRKERVLAERLEQVQGLLELLLEGELPIDYVRTRYAELCQEWDAS